MIGTRQVAPLGILRIERVNRFLDRMKSK